jgi:hypothetical protein
LSDKPTVTATYPVSMRGVDPAQLPLLRPANLSVHAIVCKDGSIGIRLRDLDEPDLGLRAHLPAELVEHEEDDQQVDVNGNVLPPCLAHGAGEESIVVKGRYPSITRAIMSPAAMVATVTQEVDGSLTVRVDDSNNPDFWLEVSAPASSVRVANKEQT